MPNGIKLLKENPRYLNNKDNIYLDAVSARHYESLTRTKSAEAMRKLAYDYSYNLAPFFQKLENSEAKKLLAFKL